MTRQGVRRPSYARMPNPIILPNEFMTGNDVIHAETLPPLADPIARELNDELVRQYGQLLPPAALAKVLGVSFWQCFLPGRYSRDRADSVT